MVQMGQMLAHSYGRGGAEVPSNVGTVQRSPLPPLPHTTEERIETEGSMIYQGESSQQVGGEGYPL